MGNGLVKFGNKSMSALARQRNSSWLQPAFESVRCRAGSLERQNPVGSYLPLSIRKQIKGELVEITAYEDDTVQCTMHYLD